MKAIKVLIAVKSNALARVIHHVLNGQAGISTIDFAESGQDLMGQAQQLRPSLIIVNSRLLGRSPSVALGQLKRANPQSKVILTCDREEFGRPKAADTVDAQVLEESLVQKLPTVARRLIQPRPVKSSIAQACGFVLAVMLLSFTSSAFAGQAGTAPSTYSAYSGTDTKVIPPAPSLGPSNSVSTDPTFGSRILRVTDPNTLGGESFISTDAGFHRTWNANSTAIKLTGPHGDGYWLGFDPTAFKVGDGSAQPVPHAVPFGATWEWSTVDPDIIYFLQGNQIAKYNKSTGAITNLGGPSTTDSLGYMAVVIGLDNWVCAAAGSGQQDSYSKIFCINPISPATNRLIDVYGKTVDGVPQGDPNWPTSAPGQVIGIHDISGGTGASWLEVTFHQQSWGGDGGAVLDLATNTWSLVTAADGYWSGHVSMGNGGYANSSGSVNGSDSRGMVVRNPDNLMNASNYRFVGQPPDTKNGWCDADHSSWLNSVNNPNAPILSSRYTIGSNCQFAFTGEIDAAAVDGSNTVWRFAHNHNGGFVCYYAQAFAQISNDGHWALFSSYWDGALGSDTSFGCSTRIDTFIVDLMSAGSSSTTPTTTPTTTTPATTPTPAPTAPVTTAPSSATSWVRSEQNSSAVTFVNTWFPNGGAFNSGGSAMMAIDPGARATFSFTGTSARWIAYRDQWSGIANIYIDGTAAGQVDTYASAAQAQTIAYTTPVLAAGNHTLTIEATGQVDANSGGAWIWVDAFDSAAQTSTSTTSTTVDSSVPAAAARLTTVISMGNSSGTTATEVGYGEISSGMGVAVLQSYSDQDLVSEAAIPATAPATNWVMYAEQRTGVSTGVAIANPNNVDVNVTLTLSDGRQTSLVVPALGQHAAFVGELFGNFSGSFIGTLTAQANSPIAVLALRGTTNATDQFIIASIPLNSGAPAAGGTKIFPSVADGGGYNSQLILVNSGSTVSTGTIQFSFPVATNVGTAGPFSFTIPAGGVWSMQTMGTPGTVTSGYATLAVTDGSPMPNATAMVRLSSNGNLISETAVPAQDQVTSSTLFGSFESNTRTGIAIANPTTQGVQVTLSAFDANGNSVASPTTVTVPASSQTSAFLDELMSGLPAGFEGSVSLGAASPVYAVSIRGTTNNRGGFLMSTQPMVDANQMQSGTHYFPHVVGGGTYKTEFLLINQGAALPALNLFGTDGKPLSLPLQ